VYKQILINAKLQIVKRGHNTELTEKSQLRRSALDFSAIEEEEDGYVYGGNDWQRDLSLINQPKGSHASIYTVALACANIEVT
jgi:hypothetical protein